MQVKMYLLSPMKPFHNHLQTCRGENVEEAFLETAKKIYQNIQDGRYVRDEQGYLKAVAGCIIWDLALVFNVSLVSATLSLISAFGCV